MEYTPIAVSLGSIPEFLKRYLERGSYVPPAEKSVHFAGFWAPSRHHSGDV
jgi:hypothetical protein